MSLAEFVDRLGRIPLGSHPGERWRYSYATDVLGRLLEVRGLLVEVALNGRIYLEWDAHANLGVPLDELFAREVFKPLGMVDSCFHIEKTDTNRLSRFAQVYEADENDTIAPSDLARQRRRCDTYERNNAFLLHSVRNDEAAVVAALGRQSTASRPTTPELKPSPARAVTARAANLAEPLLGWSRTTAAASPASQVSSPPIDAPGSIAAGTTPEQRRTRRKSSMGVELAVLSAAARPGALDTPEHPKLLSPLAGEPVIGHVLRQLRRGGIRRVVVVIGNRGAQVSQRLRSLCNLPRRLLCWRFKKWPCGRSFAPDRPPNRSTVKRSPSCRQRSNLASRTSIWGRRTPTALHGRSSQRHRTWATRISS
eukprot:scaffold282253_cov29-Tisochrysis_lutea.AAC.2